MRNSPISYIISIFLLVLLFGIDLMIGSADIGAKEVFNTLFGDSNDSVNQMIVMQSRLPKALTAIFCGAALSTSGLIMQSLFRNPLAGPYILGISSGAGLGVAILIMGVGLIGISISSPIALTLSAIGGAVAVLLILFAFSARVQDVMSLLILGIMIGSIATAIIGLLQYFTTDFQLKSFVLWTLGSLEGLSYSDLSVVGIVTVSLCIAALFISKPMNALLLGENYAKSLGVSIKSLRLAMIFISGALAGLITAYCGPIGFVGIIIPHLARLWLNTTNHLKLIPGSMIMGAAVLLLSDILSHLPADGISLPINSITSILGIPIILWIIFKKHSISSAF